MRNSKLIVYSQQKTPVPFEKEVSMSLIETQNHALNFGKAKQDFRRLSSNNFVISICCRNLNNSPFLTLLSIKT